MNYPRLIIFGNKTASLQRRHPWVFSGAVKRKEGNPKEGDIVELFSSDGHYLATACYQEGGSIMARVLSFTPCVVDMRFWEQKIARAVQYRQSVGITSTPETNAYRLVNAEGDGIPGLIADIYGSTVVVQAHTAGIYQNLTQIAQAIQQVLGSQITAVYNKSAETLHTGTNLKPENGYLIGSGTGGEVITENGCRFWVDWESGQKTGFFLDQRNNRLQLAKWANGKSVLNAFCYSGAFSVYALRAGANLVHSVDSSAKAIQWADKNVALNGNFNAEHQSFTSDVMPFLQNAPKQQYDLIILDPPAFAKSLKTKHHAVQGYIRLNAKAMSVIAPNGLLFTFSCSGVIDNALFYDTIRAAAIEAGRNIQVITRLGAPPDHPVNMYHPEGEYLKGLCLYVE